MIKNSFAKKCLRRTLILAACGALSLGLAGQVGAMGIQHYVNFVQPKVAVSAANYAPQVSSLRWQSDVKKGLNDFIAAYGNTSPTYDKNNHPYAVFDFDNTTAILDVEEQLIIWQLNHLQFAINPNQFNEMIRTGIPTDKMNATYGAKDGDGRQVSISAVIDDVTKDYAILYREGAVSINGNKVTDATRKSAVYTDFVTKMRWLYDALNETMDTSISYPWITYWYEGMTPDQVYNMAYACDSYYGNPNLGQHWGKNTWTSPEKFASKAGVVSVSFKVGITVSPEIKELYGALNKAGIDTWICTASAVDVVRAATDYFKIPGVKGIVGMTNELDDQGRYINAYDYAVHPQTEGVGKSESIEKVIAPLYHGQGPSFTAMDSQGDFNFCTEFKNNKVTLVINRIRKDDAGLAAAVAVYQQNHHIDLAIANKHGDTKYLLQGRNENIGQFWDQNGTESLGKTSIGVLSSRSGKGLADLEKGMSVKDMFQKHTKLKVYKGYKSR